MFPFQFKNKAQSIVKKDTFSLWFKVAVACVPSAIMGILFDDYLDAYLQTPIDITFCGWLWADGTEEAKPKVISKKSGRFRKWQRKRN